MALLPRLFRDPFDLALDPWRFTLPSFDHHFGLGIHPGQLEEILAAPHKLRQSLAELEKDINTAVYQVGKDGFQVSLDVQQFKPNEVTVKIQDNTLVVEGKHEEREDQHGVISRHFIRKYSLPKEVDAAQLSSALSSDGILTIKAPMLAALKQSNERVIQIQQTGPAKNSIKANPEEKEGEKK